MIVFCIGVRRKTVPPRNLQKEWLNALPLSLYERDFTKRLGKMSALSAFTPPPSRLLYEGKRLVYVCGGRGCRQAARECNGVWLGRMPARQTLYHTLVLVCGRALTGPPTGRIPDDWGDLPDHWRLRPGRWVWPLLTDNQLACTHNNPAYTPGGGCSPVVWTCSG